MYSHKFTWRRLLIMKKILALVLAAVMLLSAASLAGCAKKDDDDKGAMIQMFISELPANLDPTNVAYGSADNLKFFGLLYEGLFRINEKGELENALADEYEYYVDARDNALKLEITLDSSRWSDGVIVDADDFVYSWQRLLGSDTDNSAAALLYPIKNAKNVKEGLCSVNDLGVCAVKDNVIQISFEKDFTNVEYFLRRLASPVLVPLREDSATKFDDPTNIDYMWETTATAGLPLTNGAFKYKKISDKSIELERNLHYMNVSAVEDNPVDKVVKPYQLITVLSEGDTAEEQLERFKNKDIFYINLSSAKKETIEEAGKTVTTEIPSVYTYFFDTTSDLFKDARVRKALSIALDREYINTLTGRKTQAAEGIVPFGIEDTVEGTEFRKVGGNKFVSGNMSGELPVGDIETAKALLKEAGVKGGKFTIEFNKDRAYEQAVAEYARKVWKELGFTVSASGKNGKFISGISSGKTALATGTARVVGMDFQCVTPDAYGMLVNFSAEFAGGRIDLATEEVEYTDLHITGFNDADYDAICEEVVGALNNEKRAEALHRAEDYLIEASPVIPLFCNVDIYASKDLDNISADKFGAKNFTKVTQKNYHKYLPVEEERAEPEADAE